MTQPRIKTERLVLRPFRVEDGPAIKELAGDREIADTTLNVPHPYEDGMAEEWIATHAPGFQEGEQAVFAITIRETGELAGAIGLTLEESSRSAELGYWIARPLWSNGFATEAARAILRFGFVELGLNRISARHMTRNPASGRVMQKIGMRHEGTARQATRKWDIFEDLALYGILWSDWPDSP